MTVYSGKNAELNDLTDEELVMLYQSGESTALDKIITRYKNVVNATANRYFIPGAEKDDIIQEGLIGLYKAANEFNTGKGLNFKPYAAACVKNNIFTAIKAAARKKNSPLNSYISLTKSAYDDGDESLLNIMALGEIQNPESIVIERENVDGIEYTINRVLSKFELEVLLEYLSGRSYREIARALKRDVKAVDNAIQRIKKKLTVPLGK